MPKINKKDNKFDNGLTESELVALVNQAKAKSVTENTDYLDVNENILNQYLSNPYGDEVDGQSQVVTTDISDVVESDITSLVRVFLSSDNIVEFVPMSADPLDIQEAQEKSEYINNVIKNQDNSFKIIYDWMKSALIQKAAAIKYFIDEITTVEEHTYSGVNDAELLAINESLDGENVKSIEVVSRTKPKQSAISDEVRREITEFIVFNAAQNGEELNIEEVLEPQIEETINELEANGQQIREPATFDVTFRVIEEKQVVKIVGIPTEDFIITEGSMSKNDAELVGDKVTKTRGQLLAEGFDRELINNLPAVSSERDNSNFSQLDRVRNRASYGSNSSDTDSYINSWASEEVELFDLYMKVDFDGDGIAERRHILMAGNEILVNEIFNHVPYAILSSILMPYEVIGRSRAELAQTTQRVKSVTTRQMLDNLYMSNNSRIAANENVDLDDLLNVVPNGIIRVEGDNPINNDIIPVGTQFTGDKSLLILQHLDNSRANATGNFIANQGLDKDTVSKETATRFEGVKEAGAAKIELVARVYAETGFKDLFEGLAWLTAQFQDEDMEIKVLGKPMLVNPANWKFNHKTQPKIVNEEKMLGDLQALYGIQQQLLAQQSPLVDQNKLQNTLGMIVKGLGMPDASRFFNDLTQPDQLLQAQVEQLTAQLQQAQVLLQQAENPLKEAEEIKAQAQLLQAQAKQNMEVAKLEEDRRQFNLELAQKQQEFEKKLAQQQEEFDEKLAAQLTELELKFNQDVEGSKV